MMRCRRVLCMEQDHTLPLSTQMFIDQLGHFKHRYPALSSKDSLSIIICMDVSLDHRILEFVLLNVLP